MQFTTNKKSNGATDPKFTFGYKGKRYPVPYLIELVKTHGIEPTEFDLTGRVVQNTEIGSMWGKCILNAAGEVIDKKPLNPIMLANDHIKRILVADKSFPIIVWKNRMILDGFHRAIKAIYDGDKTIMAYELTEDILDELATNHHT